MMASEMASSTTPWLTLAIFVPIAWGLLVLAVGRDDRAAMTRHLSLVGAIISFLVTIPLLTGFDATTANMQFVEKASWIPAFSVFYYLGIDGISIWFVLLTAFVTVIVVLASYEVIKSRIAQYMAAFLILSGLMVGVFVALDGLLFYVFFEATLIPMYIIIGVWGGPNRVYAAFKFFLYTLMGSLLTLVAFIYLWNVSGGSFDILTWHTLPLGATPQLLLFLGLSLPIAPDASTGTMAGVMIFLSLVAVIYIGLVAIVQDDMKKLVAYSSVAHMGFVTLGFFIFNTAGMEGGIVQMVSHGFVAGAMFLCIGVLYDRMHTRKIADYGGVVNTMPKFVTFFVLFTMANAGLPATSGFVGEFMVIMGAVQFNFWIGLLAATALILGASYSLWMVKRVAFGDIANDHVRNLHDLSNREFLILGLMAILVIYMGVHPKPFTDVMHTSVQALLQHVSISKL